MNQINEIKNTFESEIFGIPVDREFMFSNHKNIYKKRIEKRQRKFLKKISFIKPFLKENEKVILITKGHSPMSVLEQLFGGLTIFYLKRSLFIFTNKRIFHIPTKYNYSYRNSISQILYGDCEYIKVKGGTLVIKYKNGKKEKFYYMSRFEKKKIKAFLKDFSLEGEESKNLSRVHLCPRCTKELKKDIYICPNCQLEFKNKEEGKKISIIYPGGGYFYTGHPFLGISDAILELFLLLIVLLSLRDIFYGIEGSLESFIFFLIILIFEKFITIFHTNNFIKEYIPKETKIKTLENDNL